MAHASIKTVPFAFVLINKLFIMDYFFVNYEALAAIALLVIVVAVVMLERSMSEPRLTSTASNGVVANDVIDTYPPNYPSTTMSAAAFANFKKTLVPSSYAKTSTFIDGQMVFATLDRAADDHEGLLLVLRTRDSSSAPSEILDAVSLFPSRVHPMTLVAPRSTNAVGIRKDLSGRYILMFKGREHELSAAT